MRMVAVVEEAVPGAMRAPAPIVTAAGIAAVSAAQDEFLDMNHDATNPLFNKHYTRHDHDDDNDDELPKLTTTTNIRY